MTSPPALVLRARQFTRLTVSLTNWMWPSQKSVFTPPGWLLRAVLMAGSWGGLDCQQSNVLELGVR